MNEKIVPITIGLKQAANFLGIGYKMLSDITSKGEIPHIKIGHKKLFRCETLVKWLQQKEEQFPSPANVA